MRWQFLAFGLLAVAAASGCAKGTLGGKPVAPAGNYDLTSLSITHSPAPVEVGDKVVFTYTVDNQGKDDVPAKTYDVDFYVDGERVSYDHATSLIPAGKKATYSKAAGYYHFVATKPGRYRYKLVIDPDNRLQESNESNNVIEGEIDVSK